MGRRPPVRRLGRAARRDQPEAADRVGQDGLGLGRRRPMPAGGEVQTRPRDAPRDHLLVDPPRPPRLGFAVGWSCGPRPRSRPARSGRSPTSARSAGAGRVDTSLRIVNATRQPIAIEGSPGLQPVATPTTPADDELAAPPPRCSTVTSYHVIRIGLVAPRPGSPPGRRSATAPGSPTARSLCTLAADGSVLGSGRYEVGRPFGAVPWAWSFPPGRRRSGRR